MSHFTKVKTKLSNSEIIKKALTRMGYESQEGNFTVTEYGKSEKAELLLDKSLGLSLQDDGTYAFVGDPYHCKNQGLRKYYGNMNKLSEELASSYAVEEAIENLEQQNFYCTENSEAVVGEDGLITMTFESQF